MQRDEFDRILIATQRPLRAYIAGMGVPPAEVDDIAQETFLAFYRDPERRPDGVDDLGWLKGIARNRCRDWFRRQGRSARFLERLGETLAAAAESEATAVDDRLLAALADCVARLSTTQRDLITRYYVDGESAAAIAAAGGRPPGTIRVVLVRLRDALRDCAERTLART